MDPAEHYLWLGARLGRNPSASFDGKAYLQANRDVAASGENPLLHYLLFGKAEGRPLRGPFVTKYLRPASDRYDIWLDANGRSEIEVCRLRAALSKAKADLPLISIVMPVFRPPMKFLDQAVRSVLDQIYDRWELCIHVDGDNDPSLHAWLKSLAASDERIRLSLGNKNNGISAATNAAAKLASGGFLAFFDQDDLLNLTALAKIALASVRNPSADILYSDDDKIDEFGKRYAPQFKPDWAPILLLSYMYMSHLLVVRRTLFEQLGGCRVGFEGSQDYDFALRAVEKARAVEHVPDVLYHWRSLAGSTAASGDAKPHSFVAGLRAVQDACDRRGIEATAVQPDWAAKAKVGIFGLRFPDSGPSVTIIIPNRNRLDLLRPCIESIERLTSYEHYEIMIVDNESDDPETVRYLASSKNKVLRVSNPGGGGFNFAYLINQAVKAASGEYVLLLNNDTVVRESRWLTQMVGYGEMSGVGAVGAKLYFPDNTIQHAGIIHGLYGGLAGPAFRNGAANDHGYLAYNMVAREYSAVTAACLLSKRSVFLAVGGMDERHFGVAYNDVDYCYRLVQAGYGCIYCPEAELTHHEGKSRGVGDNVLELAAFRAKYRNFKDRWYNPNLSIEDEHFKILPQRYVAPEAVAEPLRIAMFSHNLNHEGAPNSMFELAMGLTAKGYIDPVILSAEDGPLREHYERAGIPVQIIDHPLRNGFEPAVYSRRIDRLGEVLRLSQAELVYGNTADAFWALDSARKAELSAIWNIRESESWDSYYQALPEFLQEAAYDSFYSAYRVVFVASSTRDLWSPLSGRNNFTVIANGLDISRLRERSRGMDRPRARRRLGLADEEIALVLVGTVCERKNQHILLEAIATIPKSLADQVRVFIVGDRDSPYSRHMHQLKRALPAEWQTRIDLVQETDEPYLYFLAADIALCTSLRESYPRVVLEAMALGLPLITTPVFGIAEQANEGSNALFFSPHDADGLKQAVIRLITDKSLRGRFAENSAKLFNGLMQYDDMIERYAAIMREAALSASPQSSNKYIVCAA